MKFMEALEKRQRVAEEWNAGLATASPPRKLRAQWAVKARRRLPEELLEFGEKGDNDSVAGRKRMLEAEWRARSGKRHGSVTMALNETFPGFWYAGEYGQTEGMLTSRFLQGHGGYLLSDVPLAGEGDHQLQQGDLCGASWSRPGTQCRSRSRLGDRHALPHYLDVAVQPSGNRGN